MAPDRKAGKGCEPCHLDPTTDLSRILGGGQENQDHL